MKTLIIYDSQYGNTEKVARAIAKGMPSGAKAAAKLFSTVQFEDWDGLDLLVIGSPVQGGRPTTALGEYLKNLDPKNVKGVKVAVFDTRFLASEQTKALQLLMKVIGYAADKMAKSVEQLGGKLIAPPEGFIVTGKEGPLKSGELERATAWGQKLVESK